MLLLSILAAGLALFVLDRAFRIFRAWKAADEEERYELEKEFYLTYTVVYIVLGIRLFAVPLYFWTMQTLVPTIPGAMCLWGVFNALPILCWSSLMWKFALPVLYSGWLILARINDRCRRNPLLRNLMGLYLVLSPLLVIDSVIDLVVFSRLNPVQVTCCTSAIDIWPRPIPLLLMGVPSQLLLLATFFAFSLTYAFLSYASSRKSAFEWPARTMSLALIPISVLTTTEVLTPWIMDLPLHHCPFCLLYRQPTSSLSLAMLWFSLVAPWCCLLTKGLGRVDEESIQAEQETRGLLWVGASLALIIGVAFIAVDLIALVV